MFCGFIPDHVLKGIGDKKSLESSKKVKANRNMIRRFFKRYPSLVEDKTEHRLTYDCQNRTELPGVLVLEDNSDLPADEIARKAHAGANTVYHFFAEQFGRDSLDDNGLTLISSVHFDKDYNNAYWNGEQMCYGDGSGDFFIPLANGIDVICHELSHGVTQYTANLVYWFQSGALNESFSDIFAIALKSYLNKDKDVKSVDWLIGNTIVGKGFPGVALRSFKDEKAFVGDTQPKYMKNFTWSLQDNGSVHDNSGIHNFFFYNLCQIMNEVPSGRPIQIMYHTLLNIGKFTGFRGCAKEAIKQAKRLYGDAAAEQVRQAYQIVGIL